MPARIVTLTLNPAIDVASEAAAVRPTEKIRTFADRFDPGGGGVNVARVIAALGGEAHALVLAGGATGQWLGELLNAAGIGWERVPIAGRSRVSLTVHDRSSGLEYRFVPEGPRVTEAEWQAVLARLATLDAAWLVASGSLPPGVPDDFYARVGALARARGLRFALDTSGPALRAAAAAGAGIAVLKVSLGELESLRRRRLATAAAQDAEAAALVRAGAADRVAVSLGEEGALLATAAGVRRLAGPAVTVRSAVGAGDSFLAALVLALARGADDGAALAAGVAAGTIAVTRVGTAQVVRAEVEALAERLRPSSG